MGSFEKTVNRFAKRFILSSVLNTPLVYDLIGFIYFIFSLEPTNPVKISLNKSVLKNLKQKSVYFDLSCQPRKVNQNSFHVTSHYKQP